MRLIDADALWSYFKAGADWRTAQLTINLEVLYDVIHSIGTVKCGACEAHLEYDPREPSKSALYCPLLDYYPNDDFGCSHFERKAP